MSRSSIEEWLDAFVRAPEFLEAYPYYAAILAKLTPVADPSVKRMAVSLHDGRFYLHVNVDSFLAEPHYLRGILLHEVHHVVLGHLTHPKFREVSEPELMELAVEMSANEHIEEPLPNPIVWRAYAACGIRAGQSTMERYEALLAHAEETGQRPRPDKNAAPGEHVDDHRPQRDADRSGAGVTQTALMLRNALDDAPSPPPEEKEDAERGFARRWLVAGKTPGRLVEELQGTTDAPTRFVDWKTALRMFVARSRAPVHTWSRPNRRFPGRVFEVPGRMWAPRRSFDPNVVVAIDTSLSMTRPELDEIARQLVVLSESAHLTIAECDVGIRRVYPFAGALDHVVGRGGTDLRPVFDDGFLGAHRADGVIYFTDGEGPWPSDPPRVPTLWVLTKPHLFGCPWGERAYLSKRRV